MNDFQLGEYNLSQFGGYICSKPKIEIAEYADEMIDIPGGDRSVYLDKKYYKNVEFEREVTIINRNKLLKNRELLRSFIDWLSVERGYRDFRDTQHPGLHCKCTVKNTSEITRNLFNTSTITIKFTREPFWYSDEGSKPHSFSLNTDNDENELKIYNPFSYESYPDLIFHFKKSSAFRLGLQINDYSYTLDIPSSYNTLEIIGSEKESFLSLTNSTQSKLPYFAQYIFPRFKKGENIIKIANSTGNAVSSVDITPNWRCLY